LGTLYILEQALYASDRLYLHGAGTQENVIYGFGSARHGQVGIPVSGPHRVRSCNLPRVIHGFENHNVVYICANGDQSAALSGNFLSCYCLKHFILLS